MAARYVIHPLPADFEAAALNDAGLVVGTRRDRAVLWRNGTVTVLPGRVRDGSSISRDSALGISGNGRIAGVVGWHYGEPFVIPSRATLWQGGKRFAAPAVEGFSHGVFTGVNGRGEAVGWAGTATMFEDRDAAGAIGETGFTTQYGKALYWDGKSVQAVGWGMLSAINDTGATVGTISGDAVFRPNATSPWVKITRGVANAVSPKNRVGGDRMAGDSKRVQTETTVDGKTRRAYFPLWRGFAWRAGSLSDLPPLPGFAGSHANGINDADLVVGRCDDDKDENSVATLWRDGKPENLNVLAPFPGLKLTDSLGINVHGWILVKAKDRKERERYLLLNPSSGR